jgi:hypothetical protein
MSRKSTRTRSGERSVSAAVVSAVADYKGVSEFALDRALYNVIDPDALDNLFKQSRGVVRFDYLDCMVAVNQDGVVTVSSEGDSG